ncbi:MAG: hypothetical protein IH903_05270, partial [Proteobacteria bacterium]|nr:hypothetical protein [Pseudomonadota bacterium]
MKKQIYLLIVGVVLLSGSTDAMKRKRTSQAYQPRTSKKRKLEEPVTPKKLNLRRLISVQKKDGLETSIAALTAISWEDLQTFKQMFQKE